MSDGKTKEELLSIDWSKESLPHSHPIDLGANLTEIFEVATGKVVARVEPGYRYFWNHSHIHIAPMGWAGVWNRQTHKWE